MAQPTTGRLAGRVVLVTGAESGIGREVARRAAQEGADVAVIGLDAAALDTVVGEVRALGRRAAGHRADVAVEREITAAVTALAGELGPLHAAHANAGILRPAAPVTDLDLTEWDRILAVNLTGVLLTFRAALAQFAPAGGVLLATGSSLAVRPAVGQLAYTAAKAGVHALARSLALELAPRGIRVNVVAPGLADTPMTRAIDGHIERGLGSVPLGRLVDPADVAAMAVHLMTDDARSITGAVVTVDAGRSAG